MTDFTDEQLEAVRAAIEMTQLADEVRHDVSDSVIARLRPAPVFRAGEVCYDLKHKEYFQWRPSIDTMLPNVRRLRLSEMPQAVEDLREADTELRAAIIDAKRLPDWDDTLKAINAALDKHSDALTAFDEQIEP